MYSLVVILSITIVVSINAKVDLEYQRQRALKQHNQLRRCHNVPDLVLDGELNQSAQKYAETMARTGEFKHSYPDKLGENLAYESIYVPKTNSQQYIADFEKKYMNSTVSISWYCEFKDYDFNRGNSPTNGVILHFTQMVWKTTSKLGYGVAERISETDDGMYTVITIYACAHYFEQGNIGSDMDFVEYVPPPRRSPAAQQRILKLCNAEN
ncbi:hypothetical protein GJ496_007239 [Pomphorhynchus laevis]|nr:hypothetical protein GJ496_007239 [Pomphorhynchus laevis]